MYAVANEQQADVVQVKDAARKVAGTTAQNPIPSVSKTAEAPPLSTAALGINKVTGAIGNFFWNFFNSGQTSKRERRQAAVEARNGFVERNIPKAHDIAILPDLRTEHAKRVDQTIDDAVAGAQDRAAQRQRNANIVTAFTPIINDVRDFIEVVTGNDAVTGEPLTREEYDMTIRAAITPGVSGSEIRAVARGVEAAQDLQRASKAGGKALDTLPDIGSDVIRGGTPISDAADVGKSMENVVDGAVDAAGAATGTKARKLLADSLGPSKLPAAAEAQAHHIFPVQLFGTDLGKKLQSWGIDLNSAVNGVWLPSKQVVGIVASIHSGRTSAEYVAKIKQALEGASSKEEALAILAQFKQQLLEGKLPINAAAGQ